MKTRIVPASQIASSRGLRLDADYHVDPTRKVDQEIAASERTIARATKRLAGLKAKREDILEERGLGTTPPLVPNDTSQAQPQAVREDL
jgi:hypothetical protein